jgi:hypothetical protein
MTSTKPKKHEAEPTSWITVKLGKEAEKKRGRKKKR